MSLMLASEILLAIDVSIIVLILMVILYLIAKADSIGGFIEAGIVFAIGVAVIIIIIITMA